MGRLVPKRGLQFLINRLDLIRHRWLPTVVIQTEREVHDELAPFADAFAEDVDRPTVQLDEAAD